MKWDRVVARWRASARFQDTAAALGTFALGLTLNLLGLTHMYSGFSVVDGAPVWAPTALLALGCGVMLAKRRHPVIALCAGVVLAIADALLGGSVAYVLVLFESRVLAKLGLTSRVQAAIVAKEAGLA